MPVGNNSKNTGPYPTARIIPIYVYAVPLKNIDNFDIKRGQLGGKPLFLTVLENFNDENSCLSMLHCLMDLGVTLFCVQQYRLADNYVAKIANDLFYHEENANQAVRFVCRYLDTGQSLLQKTLDYISKNNRNKKIQPIYKHYQQVESKPRMPMV